jgi:hypothetical protein
MSRMTWIIVLVACGIGLAVLVGMLGTRNEPSSSSDKAEATSTLCTSVKALDISVKTLTGIDTSTATKSEYESDVTAVQNAWTQVTTDAQAVQNAPTGELDSAWSSFSSAVKNVPSSSSVSDAVSAISSSAQGLATAAESTESQLSGCVPSSSSGTTSTTSTSGTTTS